MNPEPVVLINAFELPAGADEASVQGWKRARDVLATPEDDLSTRLHGSIAPVSDFRFVDVALWQSEQAFCAATSRPEYRNAYAPVPFPFHASLYEVLREDER